MSRERKPISFIYWIVLNYLAWLIFWLFIQPLGAWLLYGRLYGEPFSTVHVRIRLGIQWLPMGLFMLAYNLFFPLSFYSWIFYPPTHRQLRHLSFITEKEKTLELYLNYIFL